MRKKYPEAAVPESFLPVASHVSALPPCSDVRVGNRTIGQLDAHTFLGGHVFTVPDSSQELDSSKIALWSPALAVHVEVASRLGELMAGSGAMLANKILLCLYVDAMVSIVKSAGEPESFVLVLPAFRPLRNLLLLPTSKWVKIGLFREVRFT